MMLLNDGTILSDLKASECYQPFILNALATQAAVFPFPFPSCIKNPCVDHGR